MAEPLKGGFASFANQSAFKPPTTGLFGNSATTPSANTGTTGTPGTTAPTTGGAFGGAGGGLFGNFAAKPPSGGLFGGGNATTSTPAAPGNTLFGGFGTPPASNAQASNSTPAPSSAQTPALGLFGLKPSGQNAASATPAASTGTAPTTTFGFPAAGSASNSSTASTQPSTTTAPPNFFSLPPKTSESTSTTPTPAPFGGQKSSDNSTSTTQSTPSLFGTLPGKKEDSTSKDKPAAPAGPSGTLFGQPSGTNTTTSSTLPSLSAFGQKPPEQKDANAKEGEKKDGTANLFGGPTASTSVAPSSAATAPAAASISVPPPSMLRGKTIEEIVNKWSSDLESHVKEFSRLATEIAVWDRALIDNGNTIAALFQHVVLAEREQSDIEQSLKHVEDQQKELSATLEVYEKAAGELFDGQGGGLRALDVGPADAERDKHYTLAADLNANLDDLSRSLMQMIDSVNTLSEDTVEGADSSAKNEAPLEVIAQILSSHLESLQWIDTAVREVDTKVTDVEKRIREASVGNSAANSVSGTTNSHSQRSRGFGLR